MACNYIHVYTGFQITSVLETQRAEHPAKKERERERAQNFVNTLSGPLSATDDGLTDGWRDWGQTNPTGLYLAPSISAAPSAQDKTPRLLSNSCICFSRQLTQAADTFFNCQLSWWASSLLQLTHLTERAFHLQPSLPRPKVTLAWQWVHSFTRDNFKGITFNQVNQFSNLHTHLPLGGRNINASVQMNTLWQSLCQHFSRHLTLDFWLFSDGRDQREVRTFSLKGLTSSLWLPKLTLVDCALNLNYKSIQLHSRTQLPLCPLTGFASR